MIEPLRVAGRMKCQVPVDKLWGIPIARSWAQALALKHMSEKLNSP